ncbi:Bcr/CflA family efflux MFS transporter [Clostridium drakei]|uniref:Bcr/CflA family efflux transporter n=1 Tax=Clostridium drakei TaxID=332101 RepID=A0A2U8DSC8_9CLOT|nr:Bcr/CflA family efflux MFS transporter [Clostridium drakei]AWI05657.1 Bcr/CflA family drug resistance efflux transporter [Clostridium drakei]
MAKTVIRGTQKYLGVKGLIIFIAVMNMFIPLSIDLYLPSLPTMGEYFNASSSIVNLTLVCFFFFFAVGIFIFGPFSDKYGRKPILIIGILIYTIASGLCAVSSTIYQLIAFRIVQALGAGSIIVVSMALIKDCFNGETRDTILAVVQGMSVIAPMAAPIIGAIILKFGNWRDTFLVLMIIGILNLIAAILFEETLPKSERYNGSIKGSITRLFVVGKNPGFISVLIIFSLFMAPYMAYISVSSYVYVKYFHLNEQVYSYFFAANSFFAMLGPVVYLKIACKTTVKKFSNVCFLITLVSGISLIMVGTYSPWLFLISFLPFTLIEGAIRPLSTSILLEQQKKDTGSASSLINAVGTIFGSGGMLLGTLGWSNVVVGMGIILIGATLIALIGWIALGKSKIEVKGI